MAQVTLSLRPSTVKCIERDLREFGTWLTLGYPALASCADLERHHIAAYKTWLVTTPSKSAGGKPLNRVSLKNALINQSALLLRPNHQLGLSQSTTAAAGLRG